MAVLFSYCRRLLEVVVPVRLVRVFFLSIMIVWQSKGLRCSVGLGIMILLVFGSDEYIVCVCVCVGISYDKWCRCVSRWTQFFPLSFAHQSQLRLSVSRNDVADDNKL